MFLLFFTDDVISEELEQERNVSLDSSDENCDENDNYDTDSPVEVNDGSNL